MPHKNFRRNDPGIARFRNARVSEARSTEYDHLLQHIFFLEERVTVLEQGMKELKDIFAFLLETDEVEVVEAEKPNY
jgi:hypothetical protein